MAENKTRPRAADVDAYLAAIEPAAKREDAETICAMLRRLTGDPPVLWGPSMIGFGSYHYRYDSGREGESFRIGFSPRKASLVVYIVDGFPKYAALTARLGKFRTGKSCLYINRLADIDLSVFEELARASIDYMNAIYPRERRAAGGFGP